MSKCFVFILTVFIQFIGDSYILQDPISIQGNFYSLDNGSLVHSRLTSYKSPIILLTYSMSSLKPLLSHETILLQLSICIGGQYCRYSQSAKRISFNPKSLRNWFNKIQSILMMLGFHPYVFPCFLKIGWTFLVCNPSLPLYKECTNDHRNYTLSMESLSCFQSRG